MVKNHLILGVTGPIVAATATTQAPQALATTSRCFCVDRIRSRCWRRPLAGRRPDLSSLPAPHIWQGRWGALAPRVKWGLECLRAPLCARLGACPGGGKM